MKKTTTITTMTTTTTTTEERPTIVVFLLDRSGSMVSILDDTIGAFNHYLDELRTGDESRLIEFTLLTFDSISTDKVCTKALPKDVPNLNTNTLSPRGSTPLVDAAYSTIEAAQREVASRTDAPRVVIVIQTDGQENCSRAHTFSDLNLLIKEKTALGWQFIFMGAGIDAYAQGARMGVSAGSTVSYDAKDPRATRNIYGVTGQMTKSFAASGQSMSYSAKDKQTAGDKFVQKDVPTTKKGSLVDDIDI